MADPAEMRHRLSREAALVDAFVHLSDTLVDDYDIIDFLHFLTASCVGLVEIDEAAVMLAAPSGLLQAIASSTERSRMLELFELQNHDGPCLDAYRGGLVVSAADLAEESGRWPTFAPRALEVGFRAVHSVPLRLRDQVIGALNLLRVAPGVLTDGDARLVRALSDIATVGVIQERTISASHAATNGLQIALNSRIRIEQAKGVLAERDGISIDDAFETLRGYARRNRLGLSHVASEIVAGRLRLSSPDP